MRMGTVHAFPIARRHVGVERVARMIYAETKDHKLQLNMAMTRATKFYQRTKNAGVPDDIAFAQAQDLAGMIGEWLESLEWQDSQEDHLGGDAA